MPRALTPVRRPAGLGGLRVVGPTAVIVGGISRYNGTPRNYLVRINPDGSIDNTFTYTNGTNGRVWAMALQPDGRILLGGDFTTYSGQGWGACRWRRRDVDQLRSGPASAAAMDHWRRLHHRYSPREDPRGGASHIRRVAQNRLVRLEADGSQDLTFDVGTGCSDDVSDIALSGDGEFFVAGDFYGYNGNDVLQGLALVNANGAGEVFGDVTQQNMGGVVRALLVQPNGKGVGGDSLSMTSAPGFLLHALDTDISTLSGPTREGGLPYPARTACSLGSSRASPPVAGGAAPWRMAAWVRLARRGYRTGPVHGTTALVSSRIDHASSLRARLR